MILAPSFPPALGGIASLLYGLAKHLPVNRISVATFPANGWQAFDSNQPFPIYRPSLPRFWQKMRLRYTLLIPWYLWRILRCSPQFILCGELHMAFLLPAWIAKHLIGASYGVFLHGHDVLKTLNYGLLLRRIFFFMLNDAAFLIPNSHSTLDNAQKMGLDKSRLHLIFPSVDQDEFKPKQSPDVIKTLLGVQGKRVILHVGYLIPRKGADKLLEALPQVLCSYPDAYLVIIGEGPYKEELKDLVKRLGLESAVSFVGNIPHEQISEYFASCEIFVMISRETPETKDIEGFGIVYLEAGLFGKPVIGSHSGGVTDAVLDRKTGFLVDPLNVKEISETMILLLQDTVLAKRLGEEGRNRVLSQFTTSAVAQKVLAMIELTQE
jgi:phosphatidylinositol alpha-1,6-mannosyltransferase